jgi:hypothetical protein
MGRLLCCVVAAQAFPDYHVFVGLDAGNKSGSGKGGRVVSERYLQVGTENCWLRAVRCNMTLVQGMTSKSLRSLWLLAWPADWQRCGPSHGLRLGQVPPAGSCQEGTCG